MPESLGNRRRVLPRGVVCDKCNNYFARKVEQPILNHHWMRNLRAWNQVPSKKGKLPSLVGRIGESDVHVNMRLGDNGNLQLGAERGGDAQMLVDVMRDNFQTPLVFAIEDVVPQREMSRFLAKMALEACAEIFVRDVSLLEEMMGNPFYDSIRDFARYGTRRDVWPFFQRTIFPADTLMKDPTTNEWVTAGFGCTLFMTRRSATYFAFMLYGVEFVINVGGPSINGYEEWLVEHNGISPFVERMGCRLVVKGEGTNRMHYLEGTFDGMKGFEFDKRHGAGPG